MRLLFFFVLVALALPAHADSARDCKEMHSAQATLRAKTRLLSGTDGEIALDPRAEYQAFNIAAIKLRTLARAGRCGLHFGESANVASVRSDDETIESFDLSETREVIAWTHQAAGQPSHHVHFGPSGIVDSL